VSGNKIILVGYSGHGLVLADVAFENNLNLVGYSDKFSVTYNPFNLDYMGSETDKEFIGWNLDFDFIIGIGDNLIRENVFKLIKSKEKKINTLISSSAKISKKANIGEGTFVNKSVNINACAKIGSNVILNTSCVIEHQCFISDSVHIAPGAILAGNVYVGDRSFVGANSVVKQGVKIGNDVIIGAGSVIVRDVPDGYKVVGNPARKI
jgi:sugar O-acyltransferase (sialic acid O-acetyltransferase NeuD family)